MDDLTPLLNGLKALGPWGVAAAFALTLGVRWFRNRNADVIRVPTPDAPLSDADRFPILSRLLKLFGATAVRDLSPEAVEALRVELDDVAAMQVAALDARRVAFGKLARVKLE